MSKHITLTVDYHDRACVIRWFDHSAGRDQVFSEVPTTKEALNTMVDKARLATGRQGSVTWLQESTTGWRVQELVADRAEFLLANVLQMPLPPKGGGEDRQGRHSSTCRRVPRRQLAAGLSTPAEWRQLRRLVGYREGLVSDVPRCGTGSIVTWRMRRGSTAPASGRQRDRNGCGSCWNACPAPTPGSSARSSTNWRAWKNSWKWL